MKRFFRKPASVGHAPGTLVPKEGITQHPLHLILFEYGSEMPVQERQFQTVAEALPFNPQIPVTWLNLTGSQQSGTLEEIGNRLEIHALVLEDILDTSQRPKIEEFDQYLFIELNMLSWDQDHAQIESEQVSLILGENYVVTFQEHEWAVFDPVRKRIREGKSRVNRQGADYLAYSLIDAIVDHYFIVLENLGEKIEFLEEDGLAAAGGDWRTGARRIALFSGFIPGVSAGCLRSHHPDHRHRRNLSRYGLWDAGYLPLQHQQPHE
jgi:magnesium transporter